MTEGLQLGPMNKHEALEVLVEVLKRAPVSFVEGYGVREAVDVLRGREDGVKPVDLEKKAD